MSGAGSKKKPRQPAKAKKRSKAPQKKRAGPLTLYPLEFEQALRGLLKVEPAKKS